MGFERSALWAGNICGENRHSMMSAGSTEKRHSHFVTEAQIKLCLGKPLDS